LNIDVICVECGDQLPEERARLGYEYCLKQACHDARFEGVKITAIGVNKSSDVLIVADDEDLRRRADAGELSRKDTGLGIDYRTHAAEERPSTRALRPAHRQPASRRPWTSQQEKIVRLYHEMGLTPAQIVERARQNTPRLAITRGLVVRILSAPATRPRS
jgi:hypothetical protein